MFIGFLALLIVLSQFLFPVVFAQEATPVQQIGILNIVQGEVSIDNFNPEDFFVAVLPPGPCPLLVQSYVSASPQTVPISAYETGVDLPIGHYSWGTYTAQGWLQPGSCRENVEIQANVTIDYPFTVSMTNTQLSAPPAPPPSTATLTVMPLKAEFTGEYASNSAFVRIFSSGGICPSTANFEDNIYFYSITNPKETYTVELDGGLKYSVGTYSGGHLQDNSCLVDQWFGAGQQYHYRPVIQKLASEYPQPGAEAPAEKPSRTTLALASLFNQNQAELRLAVDYKFLKWDHLALEAGGHVSGTAFYKGWYAPSASAGLTLQEMPWPDLKKIQPKFSTSFMLGAENFRIECQSGSEIVCNGESGDFSLFRQAAAVSLAQTVGAQINAKKTHVNVAFIVAPSLGLLPLQAEMTLWRDGEESKVPYSTREPLIKKVLMGVQISIGL